MFNVYAREARKNEMEREGERNEIGCNEEAKLT
jgi:hypothetical protein